MASEKILTQKEQVVAELTDKIKAAPAGVIVNYAGITVADDTKLRAELRKAGVEYTVIKNTLIAKACDEVGYETLRESLKGMTALAISMDDPVVAAKILANYAKDHDNFVLKAGYVDGRVLDANGVKALAETPSKEVLLGRILGSLQSSLYGFVYGIQAIIDKAEGGAEAPAAE